MLFLPQGCTVAVNGADVTSVDVGRCGGESCVTSTDQSAGQCCGVVEYQDLFATCEEVSTTVRQVLSCGCGVCDNTPDVITVSGQINLVSFVGDQEVLTAPTEAITFTVGDTTYTSLPGGTFTFSVTRSSITLALIFSAAASDTFLPHVATISLMDDVTSYSITVNLPPRPDPVTIDPTVENAFFSGVTADASTFTVVTPPNSFVDANGDLVTEPVDVVFSFLDPTDLNDLAVAPGSFINVDDEGNTQFLQSYGILSMAAFSSTDGEIVTLTGELLLEINSIALGLTQAQIDATSLWVLDPITGFWGNPQPLGSLVGGRRKRQAGADTSAILGGSGLTIWNLAQSAFTSTCEVSIVAYDFSGTAFVSGIQIQIISAGTRLDFTTDTQGKVCGYVECGSDFEIYEPSGAYSPPNTGHCVPGTVTFNNALDGGIVHIYSTANAASISALGPVYDSSGTCSATTSASYDFSCTPGLYFHFQVQAVAEISLAMDGLFLGGAADEFTEGRACFVRTEITVSKEMYM